MKKYFGLFAINCILSLGKDTIGIGTTMVSYFFCKSKQFRNVEMHFNVMRLFEDSTMNYGILKRTSGIVRYDHWITSSSTMKPTQNMQS